MRIIAGEFRSRRLLSPKDDSAVRPIPDRVRESLFSLLRGHVEGSIFVDAFAGSGSIGLEALSRGAARCIFIERDRYALELLRENIKLLGVEARAEVVAGDALGPGAAARCPRGLNLAFFDPPYPLVREPAGWLRVKDQVGRLADRIAPDGFVMVRTPWPLLHEEPPDGDAAPRPDPPRARKKDARPRRPRTEVIFSIDGRPEADDTQEIDLDGADDAQGTPRGKMFAPDLAVPSTIGPETHEYGSTAVHFYMRAV